MERAQVWVFGGEMVRLGVAVEGGRWVMWVTGGMAIPGSDSLPHHEMTQQW